MKLKPVADPGFPRGGGTIPPRGGCQHTIFPNFPKNCMKLKEFGPPLGARIPRVPLLRSAIENCKQSLVFQNIIKIFH